MDERRAPGFCLFVCFVRFLGGLLATFAIRGYALLT